MHRERSNEVCNSKLDESDSRLSRHDSESESELLRQFKLGISISRFFQLYFKFYIVQVDSVCQPDYTMYSTLFPETHPDNFS